MLVLDPFLRAAISAHTPVQFDPLSANPHEPFLALPPPGGPTGPDRNEHAVLSTLRLTPLRATDADGLFLALNDESIWPAMRSIAYPLPVEGVQLLLERAKLAEEQVLAQWAAGDWGVAETLPFLAIRATMDGKETWVGGVSLRRWPYDNVADPLEKAALVSEMTAYDKSDERILRTLGCYLHPNYQGKRIMPVVLRGFLSQWIVPVVRAKHLRAAIYDWNLRSRRMFERCGFVYVSTNSVNTGPGRGEKMANEMWLEWHAAASEANVV